MKKKTHKLDALPSEKNMKCPCREKNPSEENEMLCPTVSHKMYLLGHALSNYKRGAAKYNFELISQILITFKTYCMAP